MLNTLTFNGDVPVDTSITFETRSGNTASPDGTWSSWQSLGSGNIIQSPVAQYLQIKPILNSMIPISTTPRLDDLTVNFGFY
jgi:hypothetical protein